MAKYSSGDQNQGMPNYVRLRSGGKLTKWLSSRPEYYLTPRERAEWCPKVLEQLYTGERPLILKLKNEEIVRIYNKEVKNCILLYKSVYVETDKMYLLKKHIAVAKIGM